MTTFLSNSFSRDISVVVDGTTVESKNEDAYSSVSTSGNVVIDLQQRVEISMVKVYWSGTWGAETYSFSVLLHNGASSTIGYQTTTAPATFDRVDTLELSLLGTAAYADKITLECQGRTGGGYAILEIQAFGSRSQACRSKCSMH